VSTFSTLFKHHLLDMPSTGVRHPLSMSKEGKLTPVIG